LTQDDGTTHDRPCAEALRPTCGDRPCDLLLERHEDAGPGDEPEDPERGEVRVLTRAERPGRDGEEAEGGHPGDEHADGDRHRAFGKGAEDAVQLAVGDVGLLVGRGGPARGGMTRTRRRTQADASVLLPPPPATPTP